MPDEWVHCHFGDCAKLLSGGTPSKSNSAYWGGDLPWVSCKDMKVDRIVDAADHLTPLGAANGTRVVPERTVVFVVRGMILAKEFPVAITQRPVAFNQDLKAVQCKENVLPEFLYYWLKAHAYEILGRADEAGHGTKRIQTDRLLSMPIRLPQIAQQRQIASALWAYDDLIDNCQRRTRILEEMARGLYRAWFVDAKDGSQNLPDGWEVATVGEAFEIIGGGTPSRTEDTFWDGGEIQWYAPRDLTGAGTMFMDDSTEHITENGLRRSSARLFPSHCVMLTSRATIGAVAINTNPACTNQGFITCIPNRRIPLFFLYHWVTENVETFQRLASGATFKEISRGVFKTIEFLHPPAERVARFEELVKPIGAQLLNLQRRVENLRATRDLLLPRLLTPGPSPSA